MILKNKQKLLLEDEEEEEQEIEEEVEDFFLKNTNIVDQRFNRDRSDAIIPIDEILRSERTDQVSKQVSTYDFHFRSCLLFIKA